MTPEEQLQTLEVYCDAVDDEVTMGGEAQLRTVIIRQLIADSRSLRDLVSALDKCVECKVRPATRQRWNEDYFCDDHGAVDYLTPLRDLKTAAITRKLGL